MITIHARIDLSKGDFTDLDALLEKVGLNKGGRVQYAIDKTVIDYSTPYVPASPDRTLEFSAEIATELGSGVVIWDTPYARYQYYGRVMTDEAGRTWVGPGEKKPIITDRPLTYDKSQNPMAGSRWFERMKADRLSDILDEARRVAIQGE